MNSTRKRTTRDKMDLASQALMTRLEDMQRHKTTGRLVLEVTVNCGGIVNANISMQEPVFQNPRKQDD